MAGEIVAEWRQMHRKRKADTAGLGLSRTSSNLSVMSEATEPDQSPKATQLSQAAPQDSLMDPSEDAGQKANGRDKMTPQREKVKQKLKEALTSTDKIEVKEGS